MAYIAETRMISRRTRISGSFCRCPGFILNCGKLKHRYRNAIGYAHDGEEAYA